MSSSAVDLACSASATSGTPPWLVAGGFIPVLLGIVGMFWGITFICEEYGVPSITAFCKRNKISDAFAGAVFIGTGLSLPVFFVALAGLFVSNSAIGVGAVVGGNLFNHLVTMATSIWVCPDRSMKLDPIIFTREMLLYLLSCLLLIAMVRGNLTPALANAFKKHTWEGCLSITWVRSMVLVLAYGLYCLIDANFYRIEGWLRAETKIDAPAAVSVTAAPAAGKDDIECSVITTTDLQLEAIGIKEEQSRGAAGESKKSMLESSFDNIEPQIFVVPEQLHSKMLFYVTYPMRVMIYLTVPDVRRPGRETKAILSVAAVITWLAVQSYVLTLCLTLIGEWWHIDGSVMGLTVAAWAANFPAHWSSMVVSRQGYGDVSCCNCLGSNVFNNLIGLGLPWLLYNLYNRGAPYSALQDSGVVISIIVMMAIIVVHYAMVAASNWTMTVWMMPVMLGLYVGSIFFLCYLEMVLV